ncbi:MAG TPA: hypothetical protein PK431_10760 [Chitinophagales bacterium]|nr:hypothetical protein [Chitinophagales bacterium]
MAKVLEVTEDARDLFSKHIADNGIKQTWVADKLGLSYGHFSLILKKERDLSENNRTKLNALFSTNY